MACAIIAKTEHPHIVCLEGVCGGEPIIDGLRVTVRHVATLYLQGEAIREIADALNLTEAQVFHGLSYFFDHRGEIAALFAQEEPKREFTTELQQEYGETYQSKRQDLLKDEGKFVVIHGDEIAGVWDLRDESALRAKATASMD